MSATMAKATPTATSQAFSVSSTEEDDEVIKKGEGDTDSYDSSIYRQRPAC